MRLLGIIAEDKSDVEVISSISKKIAKKPFGIRSVVGRGCGRIKSKSAAWAQNLYDRGCNILLVVHDLDRASLEDLRSSLQSALSHCPIRLHLIVIPVREIEAWLLADHNAINKSLKLKKKIARVNDPEMIIDPKSHLSRLILRGSEKKTIYVNTIHNKRIAEQCSIDNLRQCASFRPLERFLVAHA
jgi:hypothetical protein